MYFLKFVLIFVFLFLLNIDNSYSIISEPDASCLKNIISKAGLSQNFTLNSNGQVDYCIDYPSYFKCYNNLLSYFDLTSQSKNVFNYSDFSCLNAYQDGQNGLGPSSFTNFVFDNYFFYSPNEHPIFDVKFIDCKIAPLTKKWTAFKGDLIYIQPGPIYGQDPGQIQFSNIVDFSTFDNRDLDGITKNTFNNDLTSPDSITNLYFTSLNVPSFKNLTINSLAFYFADGFDESTLSNFSTCENIYTFGLVRSTSANPPFPVEIGYASKNAKFNEIFSLSVPYSSVREYINFSNFTNLKKISISSPSSAFNFNGNIPFSSIGYFTSSFTLSLANITNNSNIPVIFQNVTTLSLQRNGMNFDINTFKNLSKLTSLDISYNSLTGTISEDYCSNGVSLKVQSNKLSGSIPSCFTCHFNNSALINNFLSNSFDNLNSTTKKFPPCTTLNAILRMNFYENRTYLIGTDIGFDNTYFTSSPLKTWTLVTPSQIFYINGTDIKEFNITFKYPQITLSISDYTHQHFISSIIPSDQNGGDVYLYGDFGIYHDNLTVYIGQDNCSVSFINETLIQCLAPPGQGIQNVIVSQNSFTWTGIQIYQYKTNGIACLNQCSNQGICNTTFGICECKTGFGGLDCSSTTNSTSPDLQELPQSIPEINGDTGTSSIKNDDLSFDISINKLIELNLDDSIIESFTLENNWILNQQHSNDTTFIFQQFIEKVNCTITSKLEIIQTSKSISFADIDFEIDKNSIKLSIEIDNYKYQSVLNRLQIQMTSIANPSGSNLNNCNENGNTNIEYYDENNENLMQYLTISKNGKTFYARLINRVISDGRSTFISNSLISKNNDKNSIIIGLNLPHCSNCIIDPDFSVLLSTNFKSSDSCKSNKKGYIVPVAVTIPIVAVAAIIGASIFFIKRRSSKKEMKQIQQKLSTLNK